MKHFYTSVLFKITVCFLLLSGGSSRVNAQYQSLLDTAFRWNVMHCYWGWATSCHTDYFEIGNDTVLNSMNYKILMHFDSITTNGQWHKRGYLREDTAAQKVYFMGINPQQEDLLYDFSVSVGDTLQMPYPVPCTYIVTNIDTVNIHSVNRRRITIMSMTTWQYEAWLSGIGNVRGLLENGTNSCMTDYSSTLLCFKETNVLKYQDSTMNTCYFESTGINEISSIEHNIYPNPASDYVKIEFANDANHRTVLTVYNQLGEAVLTRSTSSNTFELSLPLSSGLYFYRLSNEKGSASGKLLKQ